MDISRTIRVIVRQNSSLDAVFGPDDDLLALGIIDSLGALGIVNDLQKTFGIRIAPELIEPKRFRSIHSLAQLVEECAPDGGVRPAGLPLARATFQCRFGRSFEYLVGGAGSPTVLVNAYGVNPIIWLDLTSALCERRRLITWESRGFAADQGDLALGVGDHADDLGELLEAEGHAGADLIGWCSGAKVALEFYRRHPERVGRMVLIAGNYAPLGGAEVAQFQEQLDKMAELVAGDLAMAEPVFRTLKRLDPDASSSQVRELVDPRYREFLLDSVDCPEVIANFSRMVIEFNSHGIEPVLREVRVPVLVISGGQDNIAHPSQSALVASRIPGARHVVLPSAGHYCLRENPEQVIEAVSSFLA